MRLYLPKIKISSLDNKIISVETTHTLETVTLTIRSGEDEFELTCDSITHSYIQREIFKERQLQHLDRKQFFFGEKRNEQV